jgi:hypothetical protein
MQEKKNPRVTIDGSLVTILALVPTLCVGTALDPFSKR